MNETDRSSDDQRFQSQLNRVRNGSEAAAAALISEFGPHVYRVIRRRLDMRLRVKLDSEDLSQLVWASFFRYPERMERFSKTQQLVHFLSAVARNKVIEGVRKYWQTQKHDISREISLLDSRAPISITEHRIKSPSQLAIAKERFERMIDGLSHRNQQIICLRIAGASYVQIAADLGLHERTVRKVVAQLKRQSMEAEREE
jgi:RNA polymerase sigma-70 factor (ECF subfamily)